MSQNNCLGCGTCCRKGGPALHLADLSLVNSGAIALEKLVCFRRGELLLDPVEGGVKPLQEEMVKIYDLNQGCCYLNADSRCSIYETRPWECRALECWNPGRLAEGYARKRLKRKDILADNLNLQQIVDYHQQSFEIQLVKDILTGEAKISDVEMETRLVEFFRHELIFRDVFQEKTGCKPGLLLFLFGRPLYLAAFGLNPLIGKRSFQKLFE